MGFQYIDTLVTEYSVLNKTNRKKIASKLAEILDTVNYLHPFKHLKILMV